MKVKDKSNVNIMRSKAVNQAELRDKERSGTGKQNTQKVEVAFWVVSDKTTPRELIKALPFFTGFQDSDGDLKTAVLCDVVEECRLLKNKGATNTPPGEMLLITNGNIVRRDIFDALKRVTLHEPEQHACWPSKQIRFTPDNPIGNVYRAMHAIAKTVFSVTLPDEVDPEENHPFSLFFVRTPFTILALGRELAKMGNEEEQAA